MMMTPAMTMCFSPTQMIHKISKNLVNPVIIRLLESKRVEKVSAS